jgi:hypothetical protein
MLQAPPTILEQVMAIRGFIIQFPMSSLWHVDNSFLEPFTGLQGPMLFKPPRCKRLQAAVDARRRVRRRPFVPQVPSRCGAL